MKFSKYKSQNNERYTHTSYYSVLMYVSSPNLAYNVYEHQNSKA